jgi:hypothetical protein
MRTFIAGGEPSAAYAPPVDTGDLAKQPIVELLYAVTGEMMELLGPMFWAALIILYVQAEFLARIGSTALD